MTRSIRLRPWQRAALDALGSSSSADFLAVATPGAGKTTFALAAARQLLSAAPSRLVVVVPTAHLKHQWARAAVALDLHLEHRWSPARGALPGDMHGLVTTYQQVATATAALARLARDAVVVLDEIHHAGDERVWGAALRAAFGGARRRLALSGTPFRSDTHAIPFVTYDDDVARPDFEHGYGAALAEHRVVRPVYFPRTNGHMEWAGPDGSLNAATFDDPLDAVRANQRLRTALSLDGQWLPEVLSAAHNRLRVIRRQQPDAGGLVVAIDQEHARGVAGLLGAIAGTPCAVATSDDPLASERILAFARSSAPWLVAVRMVSEGVDIPRLRVGVYATTTTTELFFRQAVGRFVRWQPGIGRQAAYLFIPDDARLRAVSAAIAEDRRHSLRRRADAPETTRERDEPAPDAEGDPVEQLSLFAPISAVATGSVLAEEEPPEEEPGVWDDPALVLELPAAPVVAGPVAGNGFTGATRAEAKAELRRANATIARELVQLTGWSHAQVNGELNRLAGVKRTAEATVAQLEARLEHGRRWCARL